MELIYKLSIYQFLQSFKSYFAREHKDDEDFYNIYNHLKLQKLILSLEDYTIKPLPKIKNLDKDLIRLKKDGHLLIGDIFEFVKIIKVFINLNKDEDIKEGYFREYLDSFYFSKEILELVSNFDEDGNIKEGKYIVLDNLRANLEKKLKDKKYLIQKELTKHNLQEYLVDKDLHLINGEVALLLRPGFSKVISAKIVDRSDKGYFYAVPLFVDKLQDEINALNNLIEDELLKLSKDYSRTLKNEFLFVKFINKEFDFLDKALARSNFAKDKNLQFIFTNTNNKFILKDFKHPSIKNCVPLSIDFNKNLILVTGVNAGGKTMLLKSVLSAAFLAKYYIPFSANASSQVPFIKNISSIMQDPQNVQNDISTFSGRIKEFNQILFKKDLLLGIDEIEIGTDANEAATLYKVLLEVLIKNDAKIIVTTHHKHLASLMADNKNVKLIAATYDIENEKPTFNFIDGIGKSYALLCAKNYGIPINLIKEAQDLLGLEANRLENLIDHSNTQITINKQKELFLDSTIQEYNKKLENLENLKRQLQSDYEIKSMTLSKEHNKTIKEMKMLIKANADFAPQAHKLLNKIHSKKINKIDSNKKINLVENEQLNIDDLILYRGKKGKIIQKDNHNSFSILLENDLKISKINISNLTKISAKDAIKEKQASIKLDIEACIKPLQKLSVIGKTKEEALELIEDFLQNAILAKFKEVLVVHGFGSGILKQAITSYLKDAKFIQGFSDASQEFGGSAAKIIYL